MSWKDKGQRKVGAAVENQSSIIKTASDEKIKLVEEK